ncbi:MAG: 50S ribosomal protein L4 [Planctomycetota bacterium]|jgi:large subunit ribosomal protein L4
MIDVSVYNMEGQEVDKLKVDEMLLGGAVRYALLKQAIVMYHANKRVGTAATKSRGMVSGSSKKLFRQKGTGNARVGNARTGKRVGGGVTFAKTVRDFSKRMPKKQRRLACDSAVLTKLLANNIVVVDELKMDTVKTKQFSGILSNLNIDRSCLVTISDFDDNIFKSARNIPRVIVMPLDQINAGDVCNHSKVLFTREAFLSYLNKEQSVEN